MKRLHLARRGNAASVVLGDQPKTFFEVNKSLTSKAKHRRGSITTSSTSLLWIFYRRWGLFMALVFVLSSTIFLFLSYHFLSTHKLLDYTNNNIRIITQDRLHGRSSMLQSATSKHEEGFAACLLLKDDNHRLIEWIAYHYQTLPLRSLVVAIDPSSVTSPLSILRRWNDSSKNNMLPYSLQTILWTDDDYMSNTTQVIMEYKSQCHAQKEAEIIGVTHRKRQNVFQSACAQYHKRQNRSWVAFIDTDEFITFNRLNEEEKKEQQRSMNTTRSIVSLRQTLPSIKDTTIWNYIQQFSRIPNDNKNKYGLSPSWGSKVCIGMARVLFISVEEKNRSKLYDGLPPSFISSSFGDPRIIFDTLRFFYHGIPNGNWEQNKWGKTLVDVSRISFADLEFTSFGAKVRVNAHRPFLVCDPSVKSIEYAESVFRVQHYLGSWDAYSARNDIRRGREIFDERNNPANITGPSYDAQPWLKEFVSSLGESTSIALLRGAGGEYGYGRRYREPDTSSTPSSSYSCALLFYGHIPKTPYMDIIISSIQTNILDTQLHCDVYVHTYQSDAISEEILVPVIQANPAQRHTKNFVVDTATTLATMYPDFLVNIADPVSSFVGQWHSMQMAFNCMIKAEEETLGRRYEIVGIFPLGARYIRRINLDQYDMVNKFYISKHQSRVAFEVLHHGLNSLAAFGPRKYINLWAMDRFAVAEAFSPDHVKDHLGLYLSKNMASFSRYFFHAKNISHSVKEDTCVLHAVTSNGNFAISNCRCRELHEFMKEIGKEEDRVTQKLSQTI